MFTHAGGRVVPQGQVGAALQRRKLNLKAKLKSKA